MRKHLAITCTAYAYFGFGMAVGLLGYDAGWSGASILTIRITSIIAFVAAVFISMPKLQEALKKS